MRCFRDQLTRLDDYVDWVFVGSIFSLREYMVNLSSRRKQFFYVFYLLMAMALTLIFVRRKSVVGQALINYIEYTVLSLAVVLYSVEPCVLILQALVLAHPGHEDHDKNTASNDNTALSVSSLGANDNYTTVGGGQTLNNYNNNHRLAIAQEQSPARKQETVEETTDDIAIVISCHRSSDVIVKTVKACLKHVRPDQIFVMDNANFLDPPDNTREVLEESDLHEVNYIYNPFGNKTLAMFSGSVAAKDFKYLLLIDDDVTIPENMRFGKHLFNHTVRAVCYPIRAVHPQGRVESLFIEWQGIEYKMSDYSKLLQNEFSTVLYPHGAICLWERSTLIECFRNHDTVFYADDVKMGFWFQRQGYEMRMYHQSMVDTEAPTTIVGPYPNYYNQRVRSWDMAEHAYAYEFFRVLFFTRHKTLTGTLVLKWFQFYSCYSVLADWIRIPVMFLTIWVSWRFFILISCVFLVLYTALTVAWDWLGYRKCPERRSRLVALLTFQVYKIPSIFIRLLGMGRAFFVYLPNYTPKPTIPELEREYEVIAEQQVQIKQRMGTVEASSVMGGIVKFPVWLDKSNPYFAHYNPKNPTYTGVRETEPDVPDDHVALPQALQPRLSDSDSVTTLTVDDALRDQDSLIRPKSSVERRLSLLHALEQAKEEAMLKEETTDHNDAEVPSTDEEYECAAKVISIIPVRSFGEDKVSINDEASTSLRDSFRRAKALSVVQEESIDLSTEPSRYGRSRATAGQQTSDSSGALTSALEGQKTFADSSMSTITNPFNKSYRISQPAAESSYPQLPVVDSVPRIR